MKRNLLLFGISLFGTFGFAAASLAANDSSPIKIGAIFSVTGPASYLGAPESKTAQMLVDKLNAEGGVLGHKLQLIIKDSGGTPEKAVSLAKQLIEEEQVLAIIGPSTSGETMQIKTLCEQNKMLLLSCAAAETIVNPLAKYVFKVAPKDSQAAVWIYRTAKANGITKVAILSSTDGFGQSGKKQLEDLAKTEGVEILVNEAYDKAATDLTDVLTKVKAAPGVQALINWSVVPAQSMVAKNMKQLGLTMPLFQSHGFANRKYVEQAGVAAEGTLFPASRVIIADELANDHPQKKVVTAYKHDYETLFKEDISTFGGHAYDSLLILVEAIKRAGQPDRDKVREAMENLKGFVGTAGIFNFSATDHTGLEMDAFQMMTVKDGKFTAYKKSGAPNPVAAKPFMESSPALQYLLSGVTKGSIYAVVAIGFNLIYSGTGVINFAQGEFVMLGGMVAISLAHYVALPVAIAGSVLTVTLVGCALEMTLFRRLRRHSILHLIIITIGLSIVMQEAALHIWDEKARSLPYFSGNEVSSVHFLGAAISPQVLWVLGTVAVMVAALHVLLKYTLHGRGMRACSSNPEAAMLAGINLANMRTLSFGLSAGLGALAGCVISPMTLTQYDMGGPLAIKGFAAAILGGLGNPMAAVAGGLLIGVLEAESVNLLQAKYSDVVAFAILLLVLFVRPHGLFGRPAGESVREQ